MDNRVFDVFGRSKYQFILTLKLLLTDEYTDDDGNMPPWQKTGTNVRGYRYDQKKGLILLWHLDEKKNGKPIEDLIPEEILEQPGFLQELRKYKLTKIANEKVSISFELLSEILWLWLSSSEAKKTIPGKWEGRLNDQDVSEEPGFRIYTEDWGHIGETYGGTDHYSIGAIKPISCWYGK